VFSVDARAGDLFLLCSDGLSTMVETGQIAEIVQRNRGDLEAATRALIKAANDSGGEDNITAVLFEIVGRDGEQTMETLAARDSEAGGANDDEEDTLHPEDHVAVPAQAAELAQGDTVVVPAGEVEAALAAEEQEPEEPREQVPFFRLLLATLVIVVLAGLVVVLAVWGLAR
jgi:cobalamin biosynthesis Mg chelatase CobN